jgi:hypothetical protein
MLHVIIELVEEEEVDVVKLILVALMVAVEVGAEVEAEAPKVWEEAVILLTQVTILLMSGRV